MVLADAHVHLHPCFEPASFFDAASRNLQTAARTLGLAAPVDGLLAFTEAGGADRFSDLTELARGADRTLGRWTVRPTGEPESLVLEGASRLVVIAGRQIETKESIELLAIGTRREVPDGLSIEETLRTVRGAGALAVVPSGFGKWWLRRGELVRSLVARERPGEFFLGETAGRLRGAPEPRLFELARSRGIAVLPGSDPFPFPSEQDRAGCACVALEGPLDFDRPTVWLKNAVRRLEPSAPTYVELQGLAPFIRRQVAIQWRNRRRRGRAGSPGRLSVEKHTDHVRGGS
jgi:hypothetical protein